MVDIAGWDAVNKEQLTLLFSSGLIHNAEFFFYCNYDESSFQWMKDILVNYPNVHFKNVNGKPHEWEMPTLIELKQYCDNTTEECAILYIHHKGVSHSDDAEKHQRIVDWRQMLEYFTIEQWEECVAKLEEYDTVGANFRTIPWPHYSGNFWWARSSYIKQLPPLVRPVAWSNASQFGTYTNGWPCKYDAEVWVGMAYPKWFCMHSSNIDHYVERYPASKYRMQK